MEEMGKIKVLFIAGFGPIVRESPASRTLYSRMLGISFKEETGGYLHTEALKGANSFALWPLSQAAQSCFGKDSWPKEVPAPQAWLELDVENVEQVFPVNTDQADLLRGGSCFLLRCAHFAMRCEHIWRPLA